VSLRLLAAHLCPRDKERLFCEAWPGVERLPNVADGRPRVGRRIPDAPKRPLSAVFDDGKGTPGVDTFSGILRRKKAS
jgi:hypothetical protein